MKGISVYLLDEDSRSKLKAEFPPRFEKFVGHHVTVKFGASDTDELPAADDYRVVGYAYEMERKMNGSGIEALVVAVDGSTEGKDRTFHITWSHGPGYSAKDSNKIIANKWSKLAAPIKINMEPAFVPFK